MLVNNIFILRKVRSKTAKKSTRQPSKVVKYMLEFLEPQLWGGKVFRKGEKVEISKSMAEALKLRKDLRILQE